MQLETWACPTHGYRVTYLLIGGRKTCDAGADCGQFLHWVDPREVENGPPGPPYLYLIPDGDEG